MDILLYSIILGFQCVVKINYEYDTVTSHISFLTIITSCIPIMGNCMHMLTLCVSFVCNLAKTHNLQSKEPHIRTRYMVQAISGYIHVASRNTKLF